MNKTWAVVLGVALIIGGVDTIMSGMKKVQQAKR